jgi:hypothetical protein
LFPGGGGAFIIIIYQKFATHYFYDDFATTEAALTQLSKGFASLN